MHRQHRILPALIAACVPVAFCQFARAVNPSPLENAYWRFEEGTNGTTVDSTNDNAVLDSINANHMKTDSASSAPTYTSAVSASIVPQTGANNSLGMVFSAGHDVFSNLKDINNPITTAFTVEASFNMSLFDGSYQCIIGKDGQPNANSMLAPLEFKVRGDTDLLQLELLDGNGAAHSVQSLNSINVGQWYHAAAVANGSTLSLYLDSGDGNGYVLQSTTSFNGVLDPIDSPWSIGRGMFNNTPADWFNGTIDEVRLSNTALDPSQFLFVPANATWSAGSSGMWSNSSNWQGGNIPRVASATANFTSGISADSTVTLNSPQTVGILNFDSSHRYTLAGSALTLSTTSGDAQINVISGNHTISAPLVLATNTHIQLGQSSAASLTVTGSLSAVGRDITVDAATADSTLTIPNLQASSLTIHNGIVRIAAGRSTASTSILSSVPTIDSTAQLDLNDNALIINYGSDNTNAARDAIRNLLINGRNAGPATPAPWNGLGGITSGYAHANGNGFNLAIGYADNATLASINAAGSYTSFGGQTVASNTILVQMTRGADCNLDGQVDGSDVSIIGTHFNQPGSGQWYFGDFDYSGLCDGNDISVLGTTFGQTSPTLSPAQLTAEFGSAFTAAFEAGQTAAVPEPAGLTLLGLGAIAILRKRRRT